MIRFPERFHASDTPGAHHIGVEVNYLETPIRSQGKQVNHVATNIKHRLPQFDFTALAAALKA